MSEAAHEKQHDATQHRLQEASRDGNFVRSRQLSSLLFCCGAGVVLWMTGEGLLSQLADIARTSFGHAPELTGAESTRQQSIELWKLTTTLAPTLLMLGGVAWLAHAWQSGFKIFPTKLSLHWERLHPANGISRLFSLRNLTGAIGGMARLICILAVGLLLIWSVRERLAILSFVPQGMLGNQTFEIGWLVLGGIVAVMFVFAGIDWMVQWKRHHEGLRLSHQEFRDEMKSIEGDPQVKFRQKANRNALMQARNDVVAARAANVIVYNRNGDVAAIRFDSASQTARLVTSRNGIAGQQIMKAARTSDIPTIAEDRLATQIVATVENGNTIPTSLWNAVRTRQGIPGS